MLPANANDASVDYAALRARLADQNKVLTDQVNTQRAIVKKNQELLKEAQKLDASNKKLMEEKKKLETENVDLEKQRMALKASQSPTQTAQVIELSVQLTCRNPPGSLTLRSSEAPFPRGLWEAFKSTVAQTSNLVVRILGLLMAEAVAVPMLAQAGKAVPSVVLPPVIPGPYTRNYCGLRPSFRRRRTPHLLSRGVALANFPRLSFTSKPYPRSRLGQSGDAECLLG